MKTRNRILSVVFLTVIYCFAIGAVKRPFIAVHAQNNPAASPEQFFSELPAALFCHTPQSESLASSFNALATPGFKNPVTGVWATVLNVSEGLFETTFKQHKTVSKKILIHHRKADLIFPFHYFW